MVYFENWTKYYLIIIILYKCCNQSSTSQFQRIIPQRWSWQNCVELHVYYFSIFVIGKMVLALVKLCTKVVFCMCARYNCDPFYRNETLRWKYLWGWFLSILRFLHNHNWYVLNIYVWKILRSKFESKLPPSPLKVLFPDTLKHSYFLREMIFNSCPGILCGHVWCKDV